MEWESGGMDGLAWSLNVGGGGGGVGGFWGVGRLGVRDDGMGWVVNGMGWSGLG